MMMDVYIYDQCTIDRSYKYKQIYVLYTNSLTALNAVQIAISYANVKYWWNDEMQLMKEMLLLILH